MVLRRRHGRSKSAARTAATSPATFDLPGLICGYEGTFGIITKLWVRLVPKATSFRTIVAIFASTADACNAVSEVIAAGMLPAAMEMLDGRMVKIVEDAFHFGFPPEAQALVLTEIDGIDAAARRADAAGRSRSASGTTRIERRGARGDAGRAGEALEGPQERVRRDRPDQPQLLHAGRLRPAEHARRRCWSAIDEIGKEYGLQITNVFHAGDGNVHPIFLYDDRDEAQVQNTLHAAEKVLQVLHRRRRHRSPASTASASRRST